MSRSYRHAPTITKSCMQAWLQMAPSPWRHGNFNMSPATAFAASQDTIFCNVSGLKGRGASLSSKLQLHHHDMIHNSASDLRGDALEGGAFFRSSKACQPVSCAQAHLHLLLERICAGPCVQWWTAQLLMKHGRELLTVLCTRGIRQQARGLGQNGRSPSGDGMQGARGLFWSLARAWLEFWYSFLFPWCYVYCSAYLANALRLWPVA